MVDAAPTHVLCRAIEDRDLPNVLDCLMRSFPERSRDYWTRGLARLGARPEIANYPRYGHLLAAGGQVVGVMLQIFSTRQTPSGAIVRCNLSSWGVDPEYRSFAHALHARAIARREAVYVTLTAAPHTVPALKALGYRAYGEGQMIFAPLLSRGDSGARVVAFAPDRPEAARLSLEDTRLLADHAALGCIALIGVVGDEARPLVFQPRRIWRDLIPCAHLVYCREASDLARFGPAFGRHLAVGGRLFVVADAVGPIPGLAGRYFPGREPRYFKGPQTPSPLDLADTELVVFGR